MDGTNQASNTILVLHNYELIDPFTIHCRRMSDSIQARSDYIKVEAEIQKCRTITQSSRFALIPEADQTRMSSHITSLERQLDEKKDELATHIARLVESDSWPVTIDGGLEAASKYEQIVESVEELRDTVKAMDEALVVIVSDQQERIQADQKDGVAMDVDGEGEKLSEVIPWKRIRPSTDLDEAPERNSRDMDGPMQRELEAIQETLLTLEGRVDELENEMTQQHRELMDEVNYRMETKLEVVTGVLGGTSLGTTSGALQASNKLLEVEENVQATGMQVGEIAGEVANLITWSSSMDEERARQNAELEQLQAENTEVGVYGVLGEFPLTVAAVATNTQKLRRNTRPKPTRNRLSDSCLDCLRGRPVTSIFTTGPTRRSCSQSCRTAHLGKSEDKRSGYD
jgi:myosin heavy subunit